MLSLFQLLLKWLIASLVFQQNMLCHLLQQGQAENFLNLHVPISFCLTFLLQVISLLSQFTVGIKEKPCHTFNTLLRNHLSKISKFIAYKLYFLQSTETQFSQLLCHLITRTTFLYFPVTCSSFPFEASPKLPFHPYFYQHSIHDDTFSPRPQKLSLLIPLFS